MQLFGLAFFILYVPITEQLIKKVMQQLFNYSVIEWRCILYASYCIMHFRHTQATYLFHSVLFFHCFPFKEMLLEFSKLNNFYVLSFLKIK